MKKLRNIEKKEQKERQRREKEQQKSQRKKRRARNREYRFVSLFFAVIFLSLAGYLTYFSAFERESFINSPYNTRQDSFSEQVTRGAILASNGEVLAETQYDWNGDEYRSYPYGNIFAHVVGYDAFGKTGLEAAANFQLLTSHDMFINQIKNQFKGGKNKGDNLLTSLDTKLQTAAYYALGENNGAVVVMQPSTGRILAMVSKSDYNPNTIQEDWDSLINDGTNSCLLNRATQGLYPPGSTFKIITALSYYRAHGTIEGFSFDCEGSLGSGSDYTLQCYNGSVHGQEDLTHAFAVSCNCAFAQIGLDLGPGALNEAASSVLFNKKLPLGDIEYKKSCFTLGQNAQAPEIMQTSIGQGDTLVSPMHMAMIVSAIANDGVLMTPSLIDGVNNSSGDSVSRTEPVEYKRLMTMDESRVLQGLMKEVVNSGTAAALGQRGYTCAGKTGSAEIDSDGNSHSWFVGYSNVENPDIVVSVLVEYGGTGSEYAVPIAASIFDAYYYES